MASYSIISVGCNCKQFVKGWYKSIVKQDIKDWECFVAIDPSSDGTAEEVKKIIRHDERFKIVKIHDKKNHGALYNRCICTDKVKNPDSIIMHLDLDDRFFAGNAISIVANAYRTKKCWLTYGSYTSNAGGNWNRKIPDKVWIENSHRKNEWSTSALRTFKKWLWDKINKEDFIMPNGEWIKRGTDLAFMFPMLEMAGKEKVVFIKDIIYYYNVYNQQTSKLRKHENKSVEYTRNLPYYRKVKKKENKGKSS